MSKKQGRAWFVCPQWTKLVSEHYADDVEAGRALSVNPRVLAKLRAGTPVAKSTALKTLRRYARRHALGSPLAAMIVDTRSP
jgi:hypothetical protein